MTSFRLKEEKRCLHAHWSLQPTHFLKDWMPIFIVDPVHTNTHKLTPSGRLCPDPIKIPTKPTIGFPTR